MDTELKLEIQNITDTPRFTRGGVVREKVYTYWLGQFGPFTFRASLEPFDPDAFPRHVTDQRAHLRVAQNV